MEILVLVLRNRMRPAAGWGGASSRSFSLAVVLIDGLGGWLFMLRVPLLGDHPPSRWVHVGMVVSARS